MEASGAMDETMTAKERRELVSTLLVAALLAVGVGVTAVIRWLDTFGAAGTAVAVPFTGVPAEFAPAEGLPVTSIRVTGGEVLADGVNAVSQVSLGASIILGALAWLAVIGCFAALALRFLRGRFFDGGNPRLMEAAAWTMVGGALSVYFLETLGRNGVLAAAGMAEYTPPSWTATQPFFVVWIVATVLGLISIAFRRGIRMQRDTEGLV